MKAPLPELHRPFPVDRVPAGGCHEKIVATSEECQLLAARFDIAAVNDFRALLGLAPWRGGGLKVTGRIDAKIEQVSVISLESFSSDIHFEVEEYFLPPGTEITAEEDADVISGGEIDLGEIVAEVMAVELDPYPRQAGESFESREVSPPAQLHPFGDLAKVLKRDGQ